MLFQSLPSLAALLLVLLATVSPTPGAFARSIPAAGFKNAVLSADAKHWTNAKRLAAGLPPHAPRHHKRATPTEPNVAKRAVPSASPSPVAFALLDSAAPSSVTGFIEARTVNGDARLGLVRLTSSGITLGDTIGTPVSFTTVGSTPFSITTIGESPAYIGGLGTSAISSGSDRSATLGSVRLTTPHARPMATGGESAIWSLDAATQKLVPYWVNPDGSHPKTSIVYVPSTKTLTLVGDVSAYNQAHPDAPASEVALHVVRN
ncbi:hypothetical protein C8Q80DRAFT_262862 [Daedaleopsis nitida]|nr:hypothetical protein C8Q80DRAFT_262862 [Daedaleopsis nitida]